MYISTHHITIRFNGSLNYYFAFDIRHTEAESWDCTIPNADIERIFKVKEDGYLYIQGCWITNNIIIKCFNISVVKYYKIIHLIKNEKDYFTLLIY